MYTIIRNEDLARFPYPILNDIEDDSWYASPEDAFSACAESFSISEGEEHIIASCRLFPLSPRGDGNAVLWWLLERLEPEMVREITAEREKKREREKMKKAEDHAWLDYFINPAPREVTFHVTRKTHLNEVFGHNTCHCDLAGCETATLQFFGQHEGLQVGAIYEIDATGNICELE